MTRRVVLITGATGFVGRQVLRAFEGKNVSVRLVIRESFDVPPVQSVDIDRVIESSDIFSESVNWWSCNCEGVDTIIHIAWYTEPLLYIQSPKNLDCLIGTLKLAQGAAKANVRRIIGIGTCFEYDLSLGMLSIESPLKPQSAYAGAKSAAYLALSEYLSEARIEFAWCRLFYLYGEGEDERRLVSFIRTSLESGRFADLSSGDQIRDFLDVAEAGRMITEFALSRTQGAINICSGKPVTVRQLAEKIADEFGRRDLLRFGTRSDNLIDPPCIVGIKSKVVN